MNNFTWNYAIATLANRTKLCISKFCFGTSSCYLQVDNAGRASVFSNYLDQSMYSHFQTNQQLQTANYQRSLSLVSSDYPDQSVYSLFWFWTSNCKLQTFNVLCLCVLRLPRPVSVLPILILDQQLLVENYQRSLSLVSLDYPDQSVYSQFWC